eukprot:6977310-Prymnesium_polylepis.2
MAIWRGMYRGQVGLSREKGQDSQKPKTQILKCNVRRRRRNPAKPSRRRKRAAYVFANVANAPKVGKAPSGPGRQLDLGGLPSCESKSPCDMQGDPAEYRKAANK